MVKSSQVQSRSRILEVTDLSVSFNKGAVPNTAVDSISFTLSRGQCLGIVGESGSGKSVTSLSILHLIQFYSYSQTSGSIKYYGDHEETEVLSSNESIVRGLRGKKISLVFQEPMSSLNPVLKCGNQVKEVFDVHQVGIPGDRKQRVYDLFQQVQLQDPKRVFNSYPHELSGGQLQRVNIAMALAGNPEILICDEPTTALDVTVQKEIINLLKDLVLERQLSLIFVCHDLDLVTELCDSVLVMLDGSIVESGPLPQTFQKPSHLYTRALLRCKPKMENRHLVLPTVGEIMDGSYVEVARGLKEPRKSGQPLLTVEDLTMKFALNKLKVFGPKKYFTALSGVGFTLNRGEVLGVVGESGSGKSTLANCIVGLLNATSGNIIYDNRNIDQGAFESDKALRRDIQLIFQDPYGSLNPRMTVGNCIEEPIRFHKLRKGKAAVRKRAIDLLELVGLGSGFFNRYPHELSGGQRQRVGIARALSVEPKLLICDECVSALDVSIQAQILNLLESLKNRLGLTMIFISHDLSVVNYISDYLIVMKDGRIEEEGEARTLLNEPKSDYTKTLIDSIPRSV